MARRRKGITGRQYLWLVVLFLALWWLPGPIAVAWAIISWNQDVMVFVLALGGSVALLAITRRNWAVATVIKTTGANKVSLARQGQRIELTLTGVRVPRSKREAARARRRLQATVKPGRRVLVRYSGRVKINRKARSLRRSGRIYRAGLPVNQWLRWTTPRSQWLR